MGMHQAYRASNRLTDWARQVLGQRVYAILGTVNPDGSPHTVPLGYLFDGERFILPSASSTRKVRNIETDPRARVLVQAAPQAAGREGWVAADGPAHIIRGEDSNRLNRTADARYSTEKGEAAWEKAFAPFYDATIVVMPERWQAWNDAAMFDALVEQGFRAEDIGDWFLPLDT
jgi:nitroimidazol reductase NimA-like FMN-containing flavoprotein (pyridoxamine 5'-phosphate oxidase superfamily)